MKAILCTHYGGPDELELAEIPAPTAGPNEAVGIKAAALNFFGITPDHRRQIPVQAAISVLAGIRIRRDRRKRRPGRDGRRDG